MQNTKTILNDLIRYCEWQIVSGYPYHPTLPSMVAKAKDAATNLNACQHTIMDIKNKYIESGFVCSKCGQFFAAHVGEKVKIKQPNPITVVTETIEKTIKDIFGWPTGKTKKVSQPIKFHATKNETKIKEYKRIKEWLDRAIQWGEQDNV